MKGDWKSSLLAVTGMLLCTQAYAQDAPKVANNNATDPAKDANGTQPGIDQNQTVPVNPSLNPDTKAVDAKDAGAEAAEPSPVKKRPDIPGIPGNGGVDFNQFINSNPFGLKVEKKIVRPRRVVEPRKPSVRLTGISVIGGKTRVGLSIKVPGSSSWINQRLEEGDNPQDSEANGVKVLKIDADNGSVTVLYMATGKEETFAFDEENAGSSSDSSSRGLRFNRRNGNSVKPSVTQPTKPNAEKTNRPLPSSGRGKRPNGGLVPVPNRRKRGGLELSQPTFVMYGRPVFDEKVQTRYIVASQIGTQREFPLGARASEPPIDLPVKRR